MIEPVLTFGEPQAARVVETISETWFNAPPEVVWDKTFNGMNDWWPHRFKPGSRVEIELRIGGYWAERFAGDVGGAVFGIVTYLDPGKLIGFVGQWGMFGCAWAGGYWKLTEQDGGTLLKTVGETMGVLPAELLDGRRGGTKQLLEQLKAWVELGQGYTPLAP